MGRVKLDIFDEGISELAEAIENYPTFAGEVINDVLWNEGAPLIQESIMQLLPESGRKWRGKKPAAKRSAPFTQANGPLAVTVLSKSAYNYLYFPDDGSTTRNHVGNMQFMLRGAEDQQEEILSRCVVRLTQPFQ